MTKTILYLAFAIVLIGACIAGCASSPGTTPTPTPTTAPPTTTVPSTTTMPPVTTTTSPPGGSTVTIDLQAKNIAFNVSTISVPAGANVVVHFDNEDQGIDHNFAVYPNSQATAPTDAIFQGQIIKGISQITYTFTAPSTPGDYYFRCDVHPGVMFGTFKVT
jgi:plastocyanin